MIRGAALAAAGILFAAVTFAKAPAEKDPWWNPDEGRVFPASLDYRNANGTLRLLLDNGPMETKDHPFFTAIGPNGRACVTCHQPADAMSLSATSARRQWERNGVKDPLFAASDGSNCPSLPQGEAASHSVLIEHGLIRIARPWPARDSAGKPIKADFTIEVVRDPSTCNLDPKYGLKTAGMISVFRRPRPVANFKYIEAMGFAYDPKAGMPLQLDPETGKPVSGNLMADGRVPSLRAQMRDAAGTHLAFLKTLDARDIEQILDFERRIYVAQQVDAAGGALDADGAKGGPRMLQVSEAGRLGSDGGIPVWSEFEAWEKMPEAQKATLPPEVRAFRESVARGARVFREKTFLISDSAGINSPIGFGNPVRNSCVFCHNMSYMGMDVAPGQVDLGTTNQPFADPAPHLPLFRITCTGKPHPHYGRTILTSDPGFALTTGKCADVGRITLQTMRGLSARAPYFSNGSAKDLRGVIDYYERRYNIGYSEQEKQDLVNLMRAL